jgi:hypothetical protein
VATPAGVISVQMFYDLDTYDVIVSPLDALMFLQILQVIASLHTANHKLDELEGSNEELFLERRAVT